MNSNYQPVCDHWCGIDSVYDWEAVMTNSIFFHHSELLVWNKFIQLRTLYAEWCYFLRR